MRDDTVAKRTHAYSFLQSRGYDPSAPLELFSLYGAMGSFEKPIAEAEAVYRKSLTQRGRFELVTEIEGPPGDSMTTSFTEDMPRATATFLEELSQSDERFTVHVVISETADPKDPTHWESKEIHTGVKLTNLKRDEAEADDNGLIRFSADATVTGYARVFPLTFGEEAGSALTVEVVDAVVYPPDYRADRHKKQIYLLTKVAATTAPLLVYSTNGGKSWSSASLTAIGATECDALALVGDYLVIASAAGGGYYYAKRSAPTAWTACTGTAFGFVDTKGPTAIYGKSVGDIWLAGKGGYLYKLGIPGQAVEVVEAGDLSVQDFTAITGVGSAILAVGASNAAVLSRNNGRSWSLLTGPAAGQALNCAAMWDRERFWIGADKLYYTLDGGVTWAASSLSADSMASVQAVAFCPDLPAVGYAAVLTSDPAGLVLRTTDSGASWERDSLPSLPTNQAIHALAVGGPNYVLAAGLGAGTAGLAALATT